MSYWTSNWLDWKIQQEIMRSDMPKPCLRWKAWGYHECSKKRRLVSRLDEAYIHGKHIKSNLFDCYQPPCVPYWETDPDLTKDTQSSGALFTPCIWIRRGMKQVITVLCLLYSKTCLFVSCVYPLRDGAISPQAVLVQNRERQTGTMEYNNMNNFPNWRDPSDFVTSFALWSQM